MDTLSIVNAGVFDGVSDGLVDGPVHVAEGRIVSVGGPPQASRWDRLACGHGYLVDH